MTAGPPDLDAWVDAPDVRTRHSRRASVPEHDLWAAAQTVRICDAPVLGRLVRWRIPGTPRNSPYRDVFRNYPFVPLEDDEGRMVAGLCGRIWTLQRDYPRLESPEEFREWDEPGTARVVFGHWVEPATDGSVLHSEARVEAVDRRARFRLRALWAAVGRFERLIGAEALRVAVQRAERA